MKQDFFSEEIGESQFNAAKLYLFLIANQMNRIRMATIIANRLRGEEIIAWLIENRTFYDLISSQVPISKSKEDIEFWEFKFIDNKMKRVDIIIPEKKKFIKWFQEIQSMYNRLSRLPKSSENRVIIYNQEQEILEELGECTRELFEEANKKHLIMPSDKMNMKEMAKNEWIDREPTKDFGWDNFD